VRLDALDGPETGIKARGFSFWFKLETLRGDAGMRREREFRIDEAYTVPHPGWELALFWFVALLFCLLFWSGVMRFVVFG
jgi:hypothetical protein